MLSKITKISIVNKLLLKNVVICGKMKMYVINQK